MVPPGGPKQGIIFVNKVLGEGGKNSAILCSGGLKLIFIFQFLRGNFFKKIINWNFLIWVKVEDSSIIYKRKNFKKG